MIRRLTDKRGVAKLGRPPSASLPRPSRWNSFSFPSPSIVLSFRHTAGTRGLACSGHLQRVLSQAHIGSELGVAPPSSRIVPPAWSLLLLDDAVYTCLCSASFSMRKGRQEKHRTHGYANERHTQWFVLLWKSSS